MQQQPGATPLRVAYFFTRFPHPTETFLQREVRAMRRRGVDLRLYSWHGGAAEFEGLPIHRFSKWSLIALLWRAGLEWWRDPAAVQTLAGLLFRSWPGDWLNYWENLYGAGIAAIVAHRFRREPVDHIHAVWASLPAMVAWGVSCFSGIPFSVGAHAYDIYEHGGDWWLREKCAAARFVHTSTEAARQRLLALGVDPARILLARRGIAAMPAARPLRRPRRPLRIVCVARLVAKKGLRHQLRIYRACRERGLDFTVRLLGDGPLADSLRADVRALGLQDHIVLAGAVPEAEVWRELANSDVLVHTGVVTTNGDRDGLPNVVPEAMAAGVVVVTAPAPGVLEAIQDRVTGLVCVWDDLASWYVALRLVQTDDQLADRLRAGARSWVEANFDANVNATRIHQHFSSATGA